MTAETQTLSNVHPIDRMAEIRSQIEELTREYDELRGKVVTGEVSHVGDEWRVTVTTVARRSIAVADAERLLPSDLFQALVKQSHQVNVMLRKKEQQRKPRRRSFRALG